MELKYIIEDVRNPIDRFDGAIKELKIIPHCVNDAGRMGAGVARALFEKWPTVRSDYMLWAKENNSTPVKPKTIYPKDAPYFDHGHDNLPFKLGNTQFVQVSTYPMIIVANMVGQRDIYWDGDTPPVRYEAIASCLAQVADAAGRHSHVKEQPVSVHFPYKVACDLAGGDWKIVEEMIIKEFGPKGIPVTIYDVFNQRGV